MSSLKRSSKAMYMSFRLSLSISLLISISILLLQAQSIFTTICFAKVGDDAPL